MSLPGKVLKKVLQQFPYVKSLQDRVAGFEKYISFPPGHYYSPLVEAGEYFAQQKKPASLPSYEPKEIEFNKEKQTSLLHGFVPFYNEMPFGEKPEHGLRFGFDNVFFTYADAIGMYCMMRNMRPARIIEIGSGFSSALLLDTNERFFDGQIDISFIEPDPERLKANLKANEQVTIIEKKIQEVDLAFFDKLEAGDFLLIDTSHVSKSGSDVNHIYFNILPHLKLGVFVHIHDIFFPFEYPEKWVVEERRGWNEVFLLRAFLAYNSAFRMVFFNDYIQQSEGPFLAEQMPLFLQRNSTVCGGLWMCREA